MMSQNSRKMFVGGLLLIFLCIIIITRDTTPYPNSSQNTPTTNTNSPSQGEAPKSVPASESVFAQARTQQEFFCAKIYPKLAKSQDSFTSKYAWAETKYGFGMYVYPQNDIVSSTIIGSKVWDESKVEHIISSLKTFAASKGLTNDKVIFVDIGSNVGFFSLTMAKHGFRVISFEPMESNEIVYRSSLCKNPEISKLVTYFNKGLGEKYMSCKTMSGDINLGDGITLCGDNVEVPTGYQLRGSIDIVPLDDFLKEFTEFDNIGYAKIDTEGHEPEILVGGPRLLLQNSYPQVVEAWTKSKYDILKHYNANGYKIYIDVGKTEITNMDVYTFPIFDVFAFKTKN